ncbi:hypothetical protein [Micromonospora carbonacea]|uniref:PhiRv1 phage protein n=1 Tax=Micromonospora carbonacea TaxID=47853 RepID=A0A7H8XGM5_9ACTN|nr:hypothetical protein [Micromonospora carbonacea]MBB5828138.1 hypothetical protein [Micromonospora carbonacea]QLD24216.1 hypothetical protein HXZ27_08295 [Micromonospora carbonacea]
MAAKTHLTAEQRRERARMAVLHRHNPERAAELRRDYHVDQLAERIAAVVNAAPPLTDEQRARLAGLLASPQASKGGVQDAA